MNSDIETLIRAISEPGQLNFIDDPIVAFLPGGVTGTDSPRTADPGTGPPNSPAELASEIKALLDTAVSSQPSVPAATSPAYGTASDSGVSETLLRTAGTMTGIGPLMTGFLKLFGSSEPEPLPALERFNIPAPISVDAGLTGNREYSALRYAQGGTPQAMKGSTAAAQAPTIQVNVQAMDSQSFIDRQDDIARAVREAMLHSNSLNDVVLEL